MTHDSEDAAVAAKIKTVVLNVRYISARHPFLDPKAERTETLAALKPRVLTFFHLVEGPVDGGVKSYIFAHDQTELKDMSVTLGSLAGERHELKLNLIERFEQG